MVAAARLLVAMDEHQAESERRRRLADVSELQRTMDRQVAERMAGLADELRLKAEREKLGQHVRRGVLLAAEWLAAPAARLAVAEQREAPGPASGTSAVDDDGHDREDVLADTVELLCERVRELEGALKGLIDESLSQGDSRKPRPALARAEAVLWMRKAS